MPTVNLDEHIGRPNVNMVTCGGQATIPMVRAVSRVTAVEYAEIVATVASCRPARARGPTSTSSPAPPPRGRRGSAVPSRQGHHRAQPGRPADDHARHHLRRDHRATPTMTRSSSRSRRWWPRCRLRAGLPADSPTPSSTIAVGWPVSLRRGRGRRRLLTDLCRQPRHHDRRRDVGERSPATPSA